MKVKFYITITLFSVLTISCFSGTVGASSHEDIFNWVAEKVEVKKDYPMPQIKIVSRTELQRVFSKFSEKSIKKWAETLGEEEADRMMARYLKEVIGLFVPDTKIVYVGSFLESCKQRSIIAHEITHYFQCMTRGKIDPHSFNADLIYLGNELEASKIEKLYLETFCGSQGLCK
jgi:hypothetical protein